MKRLVLFVAVLAIISLVLWAVNAAGMGSGALWTAFLSLVILVVLALYARLWLGREKKNEAGEDH